MLRVRRPVNLIDYHFVDYTTILMMLHGDCGSAVLACGRLLAYVSGGIRQLFRLAVLLLLLFIGVVSAYKHESCRPPPSL
jgi:hypothetical protein